MRSAAATTLPDSTTCRNTLMLVSVSTRVVYVRGMLWGQGVTHLRMRSSPYSTFVAVRQARVAPSRKQYIDNGCSVSRQENKRRTADLGGLRDSQLST